MRHLPAMSLVAALIASPLWAQSKLDKAIDKAHEQIEESKPDEAIQTLTKAAEEAGAVGYLALGRLQERLGNLEEAAAAYERAQATASPAVRPDVLAAAATFALRTGTGRDALELANRAVEAGATVTTLAAKARAQVRTQDGPGALETADRAVATGPHSAPAHIARGEALFALGRNADAEQALRQAVELDPRSALAYSRLARVQVALGRPKDAVTSGRQATRLDETFAEGFALLGEALLAENLNNWGEAIAQAQQGAFLNPANPITQTAVGRIFEANRQVDLAARSYRRALELDPGFAPARLALIEAELARGHRDAAMEEAKKAAADNPTSPQIQMLLGEMSEREGDHAAALGYLESALKGLPGNADGWALLGRAYQFSDRLDDAADAYGRAVELAPQSVGFRSTYGLLLGMSGDLDGGLAELKKVVETPGYEEEDAWVNLGWVYRGRDEPTESIAAYRKALEIEPKQVQAALGLGWAYTEMKEYDEAIAWYKKGAEFDDTLAAEAYWGITLAYIYKLDLENARAFEKKMIAAGRSDPRLAEYIDQLDKGLLQRAEQMERFRAGQQKTATRARIQNARRRTRSSDPEVRARGARDLVLDREKGLDILIYLLRTDSNWTVRIAATKSLGALGPRASKAVPLIEKVLGQGRYLSPDATDEQLHNEMLDDDFREALRQALGKIQS